MPEEKRWRERFEDFRAHYNGRAAMQRVVALAGLMAATAALGTSTAALAQVNPPPSAPQIGSNGGPSSVNIPLFCYTPSGQTGQAVACSGPLKLAIYTAFCSASSATSCTVAAAITLGATFSQTPWCTVGQLGTSVGATVVGALHSFGTGTTITLDTPTLIGAQSSSAALTASILCIGQ